MDGVRIGWHGTLGGDDRSRQLFNLGCRMTWEIVCTVCEYIAEGFEDGPPFHCCYCCCFCLETNREENYMKDIGDWRLRRRWERDWTRRGGSGEDPEWGWEGFSHCELKPCCCWNRAEWGDGWRLHKPGDVRPSSIGRPLTGWYRYGKAEDLRTTRQVPDKPGLWRLKGRRVGFYGGEGVLGVRESHGRNLRIWETA